MSEGLQLRRPGMEIADRITGAYRLGVDRRVEGVLHARAVRSELPHGRIRGIDTSDGELVAGVVAVVTGAHLAAMPGLKPYYGERRADQPVLAIDKVRHVGEPLALVIAETPEAAEEGAARVWADVDELPFVVDQDEAGRPGAPLIHDQWAHNDCGRWMLRHGDIDLGLAQSEHVYTFTYHSPTQNHVPMEPHVATAAWLPDGSLEVWSGTQSPYALRDRLAGIFGLSQEAVRVRGENIGGAFGSKLDLKVEGMVALAARVSGRPVRMQLRRDEVFVTVAKHAATVTITTGLDRDGLFLARRLEIVWNAGAYAISTPRGSRQGLIRSPGPYRIPHVLGISQARYTNTVPTGPFRGAMTGQVCWAHESAIDEIAADLRIDPLELRRRNLLRDGDTFVTGQVMHDMRYHDLLDAVAEGIDYHAPVPASGGRVVRGRGVGVVVKSTRTPSRSEAVLQVDSDGAVSVWTASVEMGQGAQATFATLAAERLGLSPDSVAVSCADTRFTPFDSTSSSSRGTFSMGTAVAAAADHVRRQLDALAAPHLDADPEALVHADGCVSPAGDPTRAIPYAELLARSALPELVGHGVYQSPPGAGELDPDTAQGVHTLHWHQGAVGVEIEVDLDTGKMEVLRAHGATYAGRAIDRLRVRQQTEGGMIFGLGQALMEEIVFDGGQVTNPNLSDYPIPSILDAPRTVTSTVLEHPDPDTEPHGVGENTVPPMAPAIGNALFQATGVRIRDLPLSAEKVLRALRSLNGVQTDE